MNDVDFPRCARARRHRCRRRGRALPVKVNVVVKRGLNDGSIVDMARVLPRLGPHAPLHRVHGRRPHERLAAGRRRAGRGDRRRRSTPCSRSSPSTPPTAARWPGATATGTAAARSASSRRSRSRSAATARAHGSRPTASSTRACSRCAVTTSAACSAPARRTTTSATRSARSGGAARPLLRAPDRGDRVAAESGDVVHRRLSVPKYPQRPRGRGHG